MGTAQKRKQIQQALNALGWSHQTFADVFYDELNECENGDFRDIDRDQIRKLGQNIKKQLQRDTTAEERLDLYLRILSEHPDYQALKLGTVLPHFVDHKCINNELAEQLNQLSSDLDLFHDNEKDR